MSGIVVFHPGLQHSHQLALALHERNRLQQFCSGVPVLDFGESYPWWLPRSLSKRLKRVAIPRQLRRNPVLFYAGVRAASRFSSTRAQLDNAHRVFHLFDLWAAKQVLRLRPDAVVAYENSAMHTFAAARQIGARCILDLPSIHHEAASKLLGTPETPYEHEINRRKGMEVRLADLILTCSQLAADTYIERGVSTRKIQSVLLGANLPVSAPDESPTTLGPLVFVFAGSFSYRKSGDLLIDVFRRLELEKVPINFYIVGGVAEPMFLESLKKISTVTIFGQVSQSELSELLRAADCLLLPSRFDAFGMVVAEALACGTPVIVSSQTGAKEIVELFPGSGWVVEANVGSIYECVVSRNHDRIGLRNARGSALEAAASFTWESYRSRVGTAICDWLDMERSSL